ESAVAAGATHIILLMTRTEDQLVRPDQTAFSIDRLALRVAYGAKIKSVFDETSKEINQTIASVRTGYVRPHVRISGIARAAGKTDVSRLTVDETLLRAAANEAREAVQYAFARE